MQGSVRIGALMVAIMAAKLFAPSLFPGEAGGPLDVLRTRRLNGGRRGHENRIRTREAPVKFASL
jgi:hypothetical protein